MKIVISQPTHGVIGWSFDVSVQGEAGEKIAHVEVIVNDFPEVRDTPDPPVDSWEQAFTQKGVFPGENKVLVLVQNDADPPKETRAERKWQ